MNQVLSRFIAIVSACCVSSVISDEISYSYFNVGVSLSDRNSEYLTDDLNLDVDVNMSLEWDNFLLHGVNDWSFHYWLDITRSRNLSDNPAYELSFFQSCTGLGLHYIRDSFSVFFRYGVGSGNSRFDVTANRSSSFPSLPTGSQDIFLPPPEIFSDDIGLAYEKRESGSVQKIGVRYRTSYQYQIGAAFHISKMYWYGNELSAYIQRDFENLPINIQATSGYISLRLHASLTERTRSLGISIAYSF